MKSVAVVLLGLTLCLSAAAAQEEEGGDARGEVTYDRRGLIINGTRMMLFSGEIHYPRSTPEMWPKLIAKAKLGGLDVIQSYVFWNVHEPIQGQHNFEGRYDLVKFIREIQAQGLYVSLRIGPFVEAEWKYGGFPFWLHDVPNITFRSDNEPFKQHMQSFVTKIVTMMKNEGLYYPQGGPIIISQIENEYQMVERSFGSSGPPYVRWAAAMAVNLHTDVPWMMCKQNDAPDPVDSDAYMERRLFGIQKVGIQQGQQPMHLLNNDLWGYQVGLFGEENKIYIQEETYNVGWIAINNLTDHPLTWYRIKKRELNTTFATPAGNDAVTLDLTGMEKGEVWVNGDSIGRYWVSFKAPSGQPSQSLYHIPQSFLKSEDNLLVLVEEMGGNPMRITMNTMSVTIVPPAPRRVARLIDELLMVEEWRMAYSNGKPA
ncbi:hypothetical protein ABZP36_014193 [Zizania latifolia]